MRQKNCESFVRGGVVGIIDSAAASRRARRLNGLDFFEWRADCIGGIPAGLPPLPAPLLLTARDPAEGGNGNLSASVRRGLLLDGLAQASVLDIEVRNLSRFEDVVVAARAAGKAVVASFHDFRKTPALARLHEQVHRAKDGGADAVKIATFAPDASAVARLIEILATARLPASVMAMGPLGMAARLLFASCGSVLNYGWISAPNVPGQWEARELRKLLAHTGVRS